MTTKDDIISNFGSWHKAKAKCLLYKEFSDLVVKFDEKINRQLNEAKSKYERIKKHCTNQDALFRAMDDLAVLRCKVQMSRELSVEMLQRAIDAIEAENKVNEEFASFSKQTLEEEDSERALQAHSEFEK